MSFVVIYDACVLYPVALRDTLMWLAARTELFHARWTDEILDECFNNLKRDRPDLDPTKLDKSRKDMNDALRDPIVEGYEDLVGGLQLPDAKDRHVLAAAIRAHAQVIVTNNLKDFPSETLSTYGIEAQTPDTFVLHLLFLNTYSVLKALREQVAAKHKPPMTVEDLLDCLQVKHGMSQSAVAIRAAIQAAPHIQEFIIFDENESVSAEVFLSRVLELRRVRGLAKR